MNKNTVYVRTDKNGTKIYHDYTCTRCGGVGGAHCWDHTGWTCYKCGGTGRQDKPEIVKEYTPEYAKKLEERRAKRHEKMRQARIQYVHEHLDELLTEKGFNDGKIYAVIEENTYGIKEELKAAGAKWNSFLKRWTFTQKPSEWATVEVKWDEYLTLNEETGYFNYKDVDGVKLMESKMPKVEKKVSEYVGNAGDKIEREVKLEVIFTWTTKMAWKTVTMSMYKFVDSEGNVLVWKTASTDLYKYEGNTVKIKGTVKEHSIYKDVKQTVLQRVKVA